MERLFGRPGAARVAYADALVALRARGDRVHEALVLGNLGELSLEDGALQEGERLLREAVDRSAAVGFAKLEGLFLASLGLARTLLGNAASGAADLARSEEILHAGRFEDALCCARATRARGHGAGRLRRGPIAPRGCSAHLTGHPVGGCLLAARRG